VFHIDNPGRRQPGVLPRDLRAVAGVSVHVVPGGLQPASRRCSGPSPCVWFSAARVKRRDCGASREVDGAHNTLAEYTKRSTPGANPFALIPTCTFA
jgi:hypothetical protein